MFRKKSDFPPKPKRLSLENITQDPQDVSPDDPIMNILNDSSRDSNENDEQLQQIREVINDCNELNVRRNDVACCLSSLKSQEMSLAHLSCNLKSLLKQVSSDSHNSS